MSAPGPSPDLLERDAELDVLRARVRGARDGVGGVLLVEGPAGVGKSALLRALRETAEAEGLLVRSSVGGELEREFGFGVVRQLLEPVVRLAGPAERDELLAGAAALAGPALGLGGPGGEPRADPSFATLHGLSWLVTALAERQALLLLVDDAHWADEPSLRFCDFLARRVEELPLLLVLAHRPDEAGAATDLLASLGDAPDAHTLRPGALSVAATRRLVTDGLGEEVADDVVASAHEATGGNPLLLRELVRTLQAWDGVPTAEVVRAAIPSSVTRSVQRRLRRLGEDAQATARALAVLGDRLPLDVLGRAAELSAEAVEGSLGALHRAGLVEDDPPRFVHPLVRQAVADAALSTERTRLHHCAARELRARGADEEQVVVHLLAAPPSGEPWVAPVLRAAAASAVAEGAPDLAVRRLERVLEELAREDPEVPEVLRTLGMAKIALGDPGAVTNLRQASEQATDPVVAARALGTLMGVGALIEPGAMSAAVQRTSELLERLTGDEHRIVRITLRDQALDLLMLDPSMTQAREEMLARAHAEPSAEASSMIAFEAAMGPATRADVRAQVARAVGAGVAHTGDGLAALIWAVVAAHAVDAPEDVAAATDAFRERARRGGSRISVAFGDYMKAYEQARFGSVASAEAHIRSARQTFEEFSSPTSERASRADLIGILVTLGRLEEADELAAPVDLEEFTGLRAVACAWLIRRAELRQAQGRHEEAIGDLRRAEEIVLGYGWERWILGFHGALLARELVVVGEVAEGRRRAEAEVADARRRGAPSHEAMALIALGHALGGETGLEAFAGAVAAAERSPALVVRATAGLEHGSALRRAGQRTEARAVLARAREVAHRAEATALVDAATQELAVAGARPRRIALSGVESLTPSERRIAEHAASGLTNREIAETLFVTRKTVEFTLGNVFTKLSIRSRTQLPAVLGGA